MGGSSTKCTWWPLTSLATLSCKQRWVILAWAGWRHLETLLRGRDDSFGNTLLKIAMTHPLSGLRVRTLTINSGDVPPLKHVRARTLPPPPVNQTLSRHDVIFGNIMLLFIAMTHAGCSLKLYTVTKNSNDSSLA